MVSQNVLKHTLGTPLASHIHPSSIRLRRLHVSPACAGQQEHDGQYRLSTFWIPTQRHIEDINQHEGFDLLSRAGFLRQAHSGIFHALPLGLRVQNKVEALIDKHMQRLGASKVSLSSISSEDLWLRSGRLDRGRSSELFRLEDRKGAKYLLSPTHEEEITTIAANAVHSYKELPLRLYQISRKYRDEPRPRQGLLRSREFLMKDLYTFDVTEDAARRTYEDVRKAYTAILEELRLPYLTAAAHSGNMGGNMSHEYHFVSPDGEDTIIGCTNCSLSMNEELYIGKHDPHGRLLQSENDLACETFVSKDRIRLCRVHYLEEHGEINIYAVKAIFPDVSPGIRGAEALREFQNATNTSKDGTGAEDARPHRVEHFVDPRVPSHMKRDLGLTLEDSLLSTSAVNGKPILMTKARAGEACPDCQDGRLRMQQAVEIGHTFHLGTRYSKPFCAQVLDASNKQVSIEMGCHGIGVSRLIGAVASLLADSKGLNWPLAIAPFQVLVVPTSKIDSADIDKVCDHLSKIDGRQSKLDIAIDDRERPFGWKLNDADLIGYPFVIVVGNTWKQRKTVELQCRRLGIKAEIPFSELPVQISELGKKL